MSNRKMWISQKIEIENGYMYYIFSGTTRLSFVEVLQLWKCEEKFRVFFNELFCGIPFSAYRWETPAITSETKNRDFEFVILNDPSLSRKASTNAFANYFNDRAVVKFSNLGNNAVLVVPCPPHKSIDYSHLATFLQNAPTLQKHALWEQIGTSMLHRINTKPVWLSTAGAGVPWLHVRLDDTPKYYRHKQYRNNI